MSDQPVASLAEIRRLMGELPDADLEAASAAPATPVPGAVQSAALPPNSAAASAAALVVLAMPISPRQMRSSSGSTAIMP